MQEDVDKLRDQVLELQSRLASAEQECLRLTQQCSEQQHRIRNALQALGLIVAAQAKISNQPEMCVRCISRIASISELNEALCGGDGEILVSEFLPQLLTSVHQAFGDRFDFQIKIEADHHLERNRARCLGLIFCEAAMNALKHGFRDANSGMLLTTFRRRGDNFELIVEDNGKGFDLPFKPREGRGLGYMQELAAQLGGSVTLERLLPGSRVCLRFPAQNSPVPL
jgi:two-component sensor histidine kinase